MTQLSENTADLDLLFQKIHSLEEKVEQQNQMLDQLLQLLQKKKLRTKKETEQDIDKRVVKFKYEVWEEFRTKYSVDTIREFYEYWSELNKSKTKMRWEGEKFFDLNKRMATWLRNSKKIMKPNVNVSGANGFNVAN